MIQRPRFDYHAASGVFALAVQSDAAGVWRLGKKEDEVAEQVGEISTGATDLAGVVITHAGRVVTVDRGGELTVWSLEGAEGRQAETHLDVDVDMRIETVGVYRGESATVVGLGGVDGRVAAVRLDGSTTPEVAAVDGHQDTVEVVEFAGAAQLATGGRDRRIVVWSLAFDAGTPEGAVTERFAIEQMGGWPLSVAFSKHGRWMVAGAMDNGVYLWDLEADPPKIGVRYEHHGWVEDVAFAGKEAEAVVSGAWDNTVGVFDRHEFVPRFQFTHHRDYVVGVLPVPDTTTVLSASYDGDIGVWDWKKGELLGLLEGHRDWVTDLVWVGDGLVASISSDQTARIWSLDNAEEIAMLGEPVVEDFELGGGFDLSSFGVGDGDSSSATGPSSSKDQKPKTRAVRRFDDEHTQTASESGDTALSMLDEAVEQTEDVSADQLRELDELSDDDLDVDGELEDTGDIELPDDQFGGDKSPFDEVEEPEERVGRELSSLVEEAISDVEESDETDEPQDSSPEGDDEPKRTETFDGVGPAAERSDADEPGAEDLLDVPEMDTASAADLDGASTDQTDGEWEGIETPPADDGGEAPSLEEPSLEDATEMLDESSLEESEDGPTLEESSLKDAAGMLDESSLEESKDGPTLEESSLEDAAEMLDESSLEESEDGPTLEESSLEDAAGMLDESSLEEPDVDDLDGEPLDETEEPEEGLGIMDSVFDTSFTDGEEAESEASQESSESPPTDDELRPLTSEDPVDEFLPGDTEFEDAFAQTLHSPDLADSSWSEADDGESNEADETPSDDTPSDTDGPPEGDRDDGQSGEKKQNDGERDEEDEPPGKDEPSSARPSEARADGGDGRQPETLGQSLRARLANKGSNALSALSSETDDASGGADDGAVPEETEEESGDDESPSTGQFPLESDSDGRLPMGGGGPEQRLDSGLDVDSTPDEEDDTAGRPPGTSIGVEDGTSADEAESRRVQNQTLTPFTSNVWRDGSDAEVDDEPPEGEPSSDVCCEEGPSELPPSPEKSLPSREKTSPLAEKNSPSLEVPSPTLDSQPEDREERLDSATDAVSTSKQEETAAEVAGSEPRDEGSLFRTEVSIVESSGCEIRQRRKFSTVWKLGHKAIPKMGIISRRLDGNVEYRPSHRLMTSHREQVSVAIANRESRIVTAGGDGRVESWTDDGTSEFQFTAENRRWIDLGFIGGERFLYGIDGGGQIFAWVLPEGGPTADEPVVEGVLGGGEEEYTSGCLLDDGKHLLVGTEGGGVFMWALNEGKCVAHLEGHTAPVTAVSEGPKGPISADVRGEVRFWNTGGLQIDQIDAGGEVRDLVVTGEYLVWLEASGALRAMKQGGRTPELLQGHHGMGNSLQLRDDGYFLSGGEDGRVLIYADSVDSEPDQEVRIPAPIHRLAPHRRMMAVSCAGAVVYVFRRRA